MMFGGIMEKTNQLRVAWKDFWTSLGSWFVDWFIGGIKTDLINFANWLKQNVPEWLKIGRDGGKTPAPAAGGGATGGGITGPGKPAITAPAGKSVIYAPNVTVQTDIKAAPGMSEEKMGWEVGQHVKKVVEGDRRAAMRVFAPAK